MLKSFTSLTTEDRLEDAAKAKNEQPKLNNEISSYKSHSNDFFKNENYFAKIQDWSWEKLDRLIILMLNQIIVKNEVLKIINIEKFLYFFSTVFVSKKMSSLK